MQDSAFVVHLIDYSGTGDQTLQEALRLEGFDVTVLMAEQPDLFTSTPDHPDMVILNLGQNGSRGLALCGRVRTAFPHCALCLVHEGLGEWEESIALEIGADAVIPRPAEARRAVAQVRAFQRLKGKNPTPQVPRLQLLSGSRSVRVNGVSISLTDAEFDLLNMLSQQAGHAVSRDAICQQMRGLAHEVRDRAIDLRIARIRQKLGDNPHEPVFIRTVRGEGYMLMVGEA